MFSFANCVALGRGRKEGRGDKGRRRRRRVKNKLIADSNNLLYKKQKISAY